MPVFEDPLAGFDRVVDSLGLEAFNGDIRVGIAVENEDLRFRLAGGEEEVEGEDRHADTLKALDPGVRPPVDFLHGVSHEGLFGGIEVAVNGFVEFAQEGFVDVVALAGFETEAGGVADVRQFTENALATFDPVVNDAVLAGHVVEEAVDVFLDDHVDVEEECRALQVGEAVLEEAELHEDVRPIFGNAVEAFIRDFGEGLGVDFRIQALCIVGKADEAEGTMEMPLNRSVEDIRK